MRLRLRRRYRAVGFGAIALGFVASATLSSLTFFAVMGAMALVATLGGPTLDDPYELVEAESAPQLPAADLRKPGES